MGNTVVECENNAKQPAVWTLFQTFKFLNSWYIIITSEI